MAAEDPDDGDTVGYAIAAGNELGRFAIDASSGALYYVGSGEDHEGGDGPYALTVRATAGTDTVDVAVTVTVTDEAEAPVFGKTSYAFELAENADGSVTRVSLGTVAAKDPDDGDTVGYAIAAGNELGRFAIDASSGELYYVGSGEDHESVSGPYALTVRAGDGTHTVDAAVTVTVTDEAEAPEFGETSYAFELAENTDGSVTRVSLGRWRRRTRTTATRWATPSRRATSRAGSPSTHRAVSSTTSAPARTTRACPGRTR